MRMTQNAFNTGILTHATVLFSITQAYYPLCFWRHIVLLLYDCIAGLNDHIDLITINEIYVFRKYNEIYYLMILLLP